MTNILCELCVKFFFLSPTCLILDNERTSYNSPNVTDVSPCLFVSPLHACNFCKLRLKLRMKVYTQPDKHTRTQNCSIPAVSVALVRQLAPYPWTAATCPSLFPIDGRVSSHYRCYIVGPAEQAHHIQQVGGLCKYDRPPNQQLPYKTCTSYGPLGCPLATGKRSNFRATPLAHNTHIAFH